MTTFLEPVKEDILTYLTNEPLSITQLTERIGRPYTTVQQAHQALRNEGKIIPYDRKARGGRWALGNNIGPKSIIPSVTIQSSRYKMTDFKGTRTLPEATAEATHDILRAWTIIATTAERMNGGIPDEVLLKRLNRQKISLINARNIFESMAFFCTQMIENPKFWDVTILDQYAEDKDWEEFLPYLKEMYNHYFSTPE
jgi:hypothetical protein